MLVLIVTGFIGIWLLMRELENICTPYIDAALELLERSIERTWPDAYASGFFAPQF